jgi:Tfp pilus assembly protein PilF
MQSKFLIAGIAVAVASASSVAYCKTAEPQVAPLSVQLTRTGETLLAEKKALAAIDQFETALAVDPKNVRAFIGMARAHDAIGLPGRAVKFYREALSIDPNDLTALAEQGEALVARGAVSRAKANLERIRKLCGGECAQATQLASTIAKGPPPVVTAAADKPAPPAPKVN